MNNQFTDEAHCFSFREHLSPALNVISIKTNPGAAEFSGMQAIPKRGGSFGWRTLLMQIIYWHIILTILKINNIQVNAMQ